MAVRQVPKRCSRAAVNALRRRLSTTPLPAGATLPLDRSPSPGRGSFPLRIALVCDWYLPRVGGIERQLSALAGELAAAGHHVTVVTPMPGAQTEPGVALRQIPTTLLPGATLMWAPSGFRALGEALRTGGFDLVHVHTSTLSPAAFAAIYHAQRVGLPTVSTTHSIPGRFRPVFGWLHRRYRWGDWPVVYSAVSRRVARELQGFIARPITILPNAVDARFWRPAAVAPTTDAVTITCVMRLVPRKRGGVLLRAFRSGRAALPARRLALNFVGDGPSRRGLETTARRWGIADVTHFHGSLTPDAIKNILRASDLFALPCRVEAFGIAALEARAMGLPVLAMSDTGVGEFIAPGIDGFLARSDEQFAEHLYLLCADDALRSALAHHNRCNPVACTWERSLDLHLRAYEEARRVAASVRAQLARSTKGWSRSVA